MMTGIPGTEVEHEVLAAQRARFDATVEGNLDALERLMADDLTYVHTSARQESKAENIAALREGRIAYRAIDTGDLAVRVEGDTALITGLADVTLRGAAADVVLHLRFLDVWARRSGLWQEVAWQSTRLPEL